MAFPDNLSVSVEQRALPQQQNNSEIDLDTVKRVVLLTLCFIATIGGFYAIFKFAESAGGFVGTLLFSSSTYVIDKEVFDKTAYFIAKYGKKMLSALFSGIVSLGFAKICYNASSQPVGQPVATQPVGQPVAVQPVAGSVN